MNSAMLILEANFEIFTTFSYLPKEIKQQA